MRRVRVIKPIVCSGPRCPLSAHRAVHVISNRSGPITPCNLSAFLFACVFGNEGSVIVAPLQEGRFNPTKVPPRSFPLSLTLISLSLSHIAFSPSRSLSLSRCHLSPSHLSLSLSLSLSLLLSLSLSAHQRLEAVLHTGCQGSSEPRYLWAATQIML